jgi:hypothetical protein
MAARILSFPQPASFASDLQAAPFSNILATTTKQITPSNRATDVELFAMDKASKASAAGLGCVRGTTLALAAEAAAGAIVFAMWLVIHLAH